MVSGCMQIKADESGAFAFTRPTHGGARHEHLHCPGASTVLATLAPGMRGIGAPRRRTAADIDVQHQTPDLQPEHWRDRALGIIPADPRTVDLSEAERIVCGGLGLDGPEGVAKLQELAEALNAALGGTRVIADRGWLDPERFIGTTGKIVAPKLYIAFGVSGAGQHISGITESETIILVNSDRTAPLFNIADLGVVADLHQVLPALIEKLRQHHTAEAPAESVPAQEQEQEVSQVA
jgi:electron transfer flavoprotein alpha subunit